MLNAVAGVWPVDEGKIIIDGVDVTRLSEHQRAAYIGRVFQDPMMGPCANMQIEENLAMASRRGQRPGLRWSSRAKARAFFQERLSMLGLGLEERLTQRVGLLSGCQRQALTLLMATLKRPDILLLDEPTNHLDHDAIAWLEEFLINFDNTVIVVSHDRYFLNKVCTHTADIDYGKIQLYAGNYDI